MAAGKAKKRKLIDLEEVSDECNGSSDTESFNSRIIRTGPSRNVQENNETLRSEHSLTTADTENSPAGEEQPAFNVHQSPGRVQDFDPDHDPGSDPSSVGEATSGTHSASSQDGDDPGGDPDSDPDPDDDSDNSSESGDEVPITAEWLANQFAKVKALTDISENGIQKMLDVMFPHLEEIKSLLDDGSITKNYRHGIKPKCQYYLPKIRCSAKVMDSQNGEETIFFEEELLTIPRKYTDPRCARYTLLWQECHTTLDEIKQHYRRIHPTLSEDDYGRIFRDLSVGMDGVRETEHGSRTLIMITVIVDECIHLWKVYNPLMSVKDAKPTLEEILR